ncbi:hypothetical protein R6Q59_020193 [Mikania micrantha]
MTYSPSSAVWWASYGSSQHVIWRWGFIIYYFRSVCVFEHHKDMGVLCRLFGHGTNSNRAVPSEGTIVLVQGTGGICGAAATSLIITPLDTIKTRLQWSHWKQFLSLGIEVMSHEKQPSTQQVIKALVSKMAGRVYI